jgi:copper resistance protein C
VTLDLLDEHVPANTTVVITGPDTAPAAAGPPTFDGSEVTVPLEANYAGRYTVAYEVLASDGHLGTGQITFDLTTQAAPSPPATSAPDPTASPVPDATSPTTPAAGPPGGSAAASASSTTRWPWAAAGVAVLAAPSGCRRRRAR